MAETLTERQAEVLDFIAGYIEEHRFPPTSREVCDACALGSNSGAHRMLVTLERKGYLCRGQGRSRALTIVEPDLASARLTASERSMVRAVAAAHLALRDATLRAVPAAPDPATARDLVLASLRRHDRIQLLTDRGNAGATPLDTSLHPGAGMSVLEDRDHWERFVEAYATVNGSALALTRRAAGRSNLGRLLRPDIQMFEQACAAADLWQAGIGGTDTPTSHLVLAGVA